MAMNGSTLGKEIADAVMAADATSEAKAAVTDFYTKLATAIVKHITTNAEVPAGIVVETTGTAAKQAGKTSSPGKVI